MIEFMRTLNHILAMYVANHSGNRVVYEHIGRLSIQLVRPSKTLTNIMIIGCKCGLCGLISSWIGF